MLAKMYEDKRRLSLVEAKALVDRGGSVMWRPDEALPEEQQYAIVLHDPNE